MLISKGDMAIRSVLGDQSENVFFFCGERRKLSLTLCFGSFCDFFSLLKRPGHTQTSCLVDEERKLRLVILKKKKINFESL